MRSFMWIKTMSSLRNVILAAVSGTLLGLTACRTARTDALPEPRTSRIPQLMLPVTVDGRLDEPAWQRAARLTGFVQHDTMARARVNTEVRAWYDTDALYLGWICEDADIQATLKDRDSKFWE